MVHHPSITLHPRHASTNWLGTKLNYKPILMLSNFCRLICRSPPDQKFPQKKSPLFRPETQTETETGSAFVMPKKMTKLFFKRVHAGLDDIYLKTSKHKLTSAEFDRVGAACLLLISREADLVQDSGRRTRLIERQDSISSSQ